MIAMANRNNAETAVPMTPPISRIVANCWLNAMAVAPMAIDARTTTVEWPSEKNSPTATGRWPCCISLRVTLSIAAMWSASIAWRSPRPYANRAVPKTTG